MLEGSPLGACLREQRGSPPPFSERKGFPPAREGIYAAGSETLRRPSPLSPSVEMDGVTVICLSCPVHSVNLRGKLNLIDVSADECPIRTHAAQTKI